MLIGWRLLVPVAVASLVLSDLAFGVTVEVRRIIQVTDNINQDVEKQRADMGSELMTLGCEKGSLWARYYPSNTSQLELVMACVDRAEETPQTPAWK